MRYLLFIFSLLICATAFSQAEYQELQGIVSYVGSSNVYVTFVNTDGLNVGDSIFVGKEKKMQAILIINNLSSISCVCTPINKIILARNQKIVAKKRTQKAIEIPTQQEKDAVAVNDAAINSVKKTEVNHNLDPRISGRVSVSSYNNVYQLDAESGATPNKIVYNNRLRYNVQFNADHISRSKFSFENYMSFTHMLNDSTEKYNGLRIFNLALKYEVDSTTVITAGRKINLNMSNVGAVDGVQYEKTLKNFSFGAILGSRPNDIDYGFDSKLLQAGAFIGHQFQKEEGGGVQTSLAFFNQTNNLITDRRYLYFQHSNNLVNNLDLFCSFETDIYKLDKNYKPISTFDLTGTYASIRYKPWKQLSMALTYDNRNNIYFYETYLKRLDSIFDKATRQGVKFQTTVRPIKNLTWGTTAGYRTNPNDTVLSLNGYSYINYANIPYINTSATVSITGLQTRDMNGLMYGVSMSRDFWKSRIFTELQYRYCNYAYNSRLKIPVLSANQINYLQQHIAQLSINFRITKKLMFSADFEATLEDADKYGRVYFNISQRF